MTEKAKIYNSIYELGYDVNQIQAVLNRYDEASKYSDYVFLLHSVQYGNISIDRIQKVFGNELALYKEKTHIQKKWKS